MKLTKGKTEGYTTEYQIVVEPEEIHTSHKKALKKFARRTKVRGFRQGHVPDDVLERAVNPAELASEEMNEATNQAILRLIETADLQLLDQPVVSVTKYVPNDTLEFSVKIEAVPEVKLGDPTKLNVKKPETKIADKDVDEVIENLRTSGAKREEVDREAKLGDEVIIDFTGLKDGVEFPGGKAKDYSLKLGSGQFIPGFEDGIVGHKKGEKFDVNVTFPKDYGAKSMAGVKAVFKINLKQVNQLTLPELNDDFAKSMSPDLTTMDDLRDDIRKELTRQEESTNKEKYENDILTALAEKSTIDVPQKLINAEVPSLKKHFTDNLMYRGLSLDDYLKQVAKTKEDWEKDMNDTAIQRLRNTLALRRFIREQKIDVTDDEIDAYQANILSHYTNPQVKANFRTAEARQNFREQLLLDKAHAKLIELNESGSKGKKTKTTEK